MCLPQFCSVVDPWLKIRLKDTNRFLIRSASQKGRDHLHKLDPRLKAILHPWSLKGSLATRVIWVPPPVSVEIHSDASLWGWGGHSDRSTFSGMWSPTLMKCHINFLELMAAFLCLKRLDPPQGCHVRLIMDNMTAVSCVRRGGSRSPHLNAVLKPIVALAKRKDWFLSANHLSGTLNVMADLLSRKDPVSTEWTLDNQSFGLIQNLDPPPDIDLFATRWNNKLPLFVAPMSDTLAVARDAFLIDWNQWKTVYIFPPIPLISRVLRKLTEFQGTAYVVAPHWPNSHWFGQLLQRSHTSLPLRSAQLSQEVRGAVCYAPSFLSRDLHVWIF